MPDLNTFPKYLFTRHSVTTVSAGFRKSLTVPITDTQLPLDLNTLPKTYPTLTHRGENPFGSQTL